MNLIFHIIDKYPHFPAKWVVEYYFRCNSDFDTITDITLSECNEICPLKSWHYFISKIISTGDISYEFQQTKICIIIFLSVTQNHQI